MIVATGMLPSGRVIDLATQIAHYAKGHVVKGVHMKALTQASLLRDEVANASDEKMTALPSDWKELVRALQRQSGEAARVVAEKALVAFVDLRYDGFVGCVRTLAEEQESVAKGMVNTPSKLVDAESQLPR